MIALRLIGMGLLASAVFAAGCVSPTRPAAALKPATQTVSEKPQWKVEHKGECLALSDATESRRQALAEKVEELLRENKGAIAESVVRRKVDVAIEHLRIRDQKLPPSKADRLMARVVDRQLGHPEGDGWSELLDGKSGQLRRVERLLGEILAAATADRWSDVATTAREQDSATAFYPYHDVRRLLALAEAERRLGHYQPAAHAWEGAALRAFAFCKQWPSPSLWEAISAQRPASTAWPISLQPQLAASNHVPPNLSPPVEGLVWFAIGHGRLDHGQPSSALAAFQRAESYDTSADWCDVSRLGQARALFALGQSAAATTILTSIIERRESSCHRTALALLGSGKFKDGQTELARIFLARALDTSADFPDRHQALADYGLVLLSLGDPSGLAHLHAAQAHFESSKQLDQFLLSLENEIAYHTHRSDRVNAQTLRDRLTAVSTSGVDR